MNSKNKPPAAGQAAHTPTPWRVFKPPFPDSTNPPCNEIRQASGNWPITKVTFSKPTHKGGIIRYDLAECEANAAFIVRACNSHAALVDALKKIEQTPARDACGMAIRETARAALASVQSQPNP